MQLSFQQKILCSMLALLAMALLALGMLAAQLLRTEVNQAIHSELDNTLRTARTFAQDWVTAKSDVIEALANQLPTNEADATAPLTLGREAGRFDLVYAGTADGGMWQSSPAADLPGDYDPRTRPWYQQALQANRMVVTPPYIDAGTGDLIISFATPLRNTMRGVLGTDISINAVIDELLKLESRWTSELWMLDGESRLIAHPNPQQIQKPLNELLPGVTLPRQGQMVEVNYQGERWLMSPTRVDDADWTFVLLVKRSEAVAALNALAWRLLTLSVLVLLVAGALLLFLVKYLLRPLKKLAVALDDVSQGEGDLTHRLEVNSQDEFGRMSQAFNKFIERLQVTITEVIQLTGRLHEDAKVSAEQVKMNLDQLAMQQGELTQLAAAAQEMSSATSEIARNAEQTAAAAQNAADSTQQGLGVVSENRNRIANLAEQIAQGTTTISEVNTHVQNITGILATIQSIAEQTNLLALNAAIEAARAGEQGRGFAVVADEVRTLSQRSHKATEEIQQMINQLQGSTSKAVTMMGESQEQALNSVANAEQAAERLQMIDGASRNISDMAVQIASAVEQQNAVTTEISGNTEQIKQVADTLAEQAHITRERTADLNQVVGSLKKLTDNFKV